MELSSKIFGKYAFTVSENIEFGQIEKPFDQKQIEAAAKASSAEAFIKALPDGYNTPLMRIFEENGIELSIASGRSSPLPGPFTRILTFSF